MHGILAFLGFIFKNIGRFLSWLLVKLGLWVPTAFTLLFLIVAAITGTKFSDVWGIYVFGLCVTVVFAFVIAFLSFFRKLGKRERRGDSFVAKPKSANEKKVEFVEGANGDDATPVNEEERQAAEKPSSELSRENSSFYAPPQFGGYRPVENPAPPKDEFIPYNQPARDYPTAPQNPPVRDYAGAPQNPPEPRYNTVRINADGGETPRIFRTRMDASLLIYEYSDRLEFFRNTPNGLVKVSVEPKK